jgi:hypothetical protein
VGGTAPAAAASALALALLAAGPLLHPVPAFAQPVVKGTRDRPVAPAALERASEAGAWWMVAQVACDVVRGNAILDRMNLVLGRIRPVTAGLAISERVQDPFLPEPARLKMEARMRQVTDLQGIAGDIRSVEGELIRAAEAMQPPPARLDRPEWKLAEAVTSEAGLARLREATDRALADACSESVDRLEARFVSEKTGILPLLR